MKGDKGFSLIEMIVAVGLFAIVMVICVGTLFALVNANRKAQGLQSVMNNLNITLDSMARSIRMGKNYHCGREGDLTQTRDCAAGDTLFEFEHYGGLSSFDDQWFYVFDTDGLVCGKNRICKSELGGVNGSYYPLTSPEVTIDSLKFYAIGTARGSADPQNLQPKVVIVVKGTAAANNNRTKTTFHIQVGATQRLIDL
ncbi:MAG: prepilin-type N-terminal cleavage/methylation domain-containing protein [bacterium]|nr:prepilin-type N-terminal cleavage/methylation domain-containing protein [bacterium]